ncbi:UNVERIFIED_CONTAM: hypothetical protein Sangu_1713300 [Sesamum angustifolium]|uniref:Uncharacterized protein n=1 Tax=Sesamum angustifolium TaxID=2727405 RepID=A0AAW2MLI6_9LAMI
MAKPMSDFLVGRHKRSKQGGLGLSRLQASSPEAKKPKLALAEGGKAPPERATGVSDPRVRSTNE